MTTLEHLQMSVERMCIESSYVTELPALALGLCEKTGLIAGAVNDLNPQLVREGGEGVDLPRHILQALIHLCAVANSADIFLEDLLPDDLKGDA
jgi:hypothetical protein